MSTSGTELERARLWGGWSSVEWAVDALVLRCKMEDVGEVMVGVAWVVDALVLRGKTKDVGEVMVGVAWDVDALVLRGKVKEDVGEVMVEVGADAEEESSSSCSQIIMGRVVLLCLPNLSQR
mmetsp:Transcript_45032/g.75098  ORF Transcript_45032/g.75098 Transcript_45032/m.75098 type:complete len:122 (-) Transcript_45032:1207-1572(-)